MFKTFLPQTVSRTSSRKSRPESSGSRLEKGGVSESESDEEAKPRPRETTSDLDFATVDITDEKAFDTDLEVEGKVSVMAGSNIIGDFYAPGSNDRGHIVVVLSVCLFVCLSVVNFNLRYNF